MSNLKRINLGPKCKSAKNMLQYLVILLDDTSVAFCHADNPLKASNIIPLETLKKGILYGMKGNLMVQFVYSNHALPEDYYPVIESVDHVNIYPYGQKSKSSISDNQDMDVEVSCSVPENSNSSNIVLRLPIKEVLRQKEQIANLVALGKRVNICYTDVESFDDNMVACYRQLLENWSSSLLTLYRGGIMPQLNILTDRISLSRMKNCDAGVSSIALAPNGKFYLCPAFYYDGGASVGDIEQGISIPNQQLLKLDHAPLCRHCDAFQCKRCVWLNSKLTWEVNTPSRQQCIMAHIERNASRQLLSKIREIRPFMPELSIKEIEYLDPFDVRKQY